MKAKLTIDEKEFEVEITEEQVQALTENKKKTGYERREKGEIYYAEVDDGTTNFYKDIDENYADKDYECANYYSDRTVAENNARADRLYRQLRRFAVEHRENKIDWNNDDDDTEKYCIGYNHYNNELYINYTIKYQYQGLIYFDSRETAQLAINTFKDELLWYFTEYKDSL